MEKEEAEEAEVEEESAPGDEEEAMGILTKGGLIPIRHAYGPMTSYQL